MNNSLTEEILETLRGGRYDRPVTNNIHRAKYVECLVAALLGPSWTLPWTTGFDSSPWDLEHVSREGRT